MDSALAEFLAHTGIHRLHQARSGPYLIAADTDVILLYVDDAPLDERINLTFFLFRSEETLRFPGIQRQERESKKRTFCISGT